eukprot:gene13743-4019_t
MAMPVKIQQSVHFSETAVELMAYVSDTICLEDLVGVVAESACRGLILSHSKDSTVRLWDMTTQDELVTFVGHTASVASAIFNNDKSKILSASWDNTVRLSVEGTEIIKFEGHTDRVFSAIFTQDESKILSASADGTVRLWYCEDGIEIMKFDCTGTVNSAIFNKDESKILTASVDGIVRLWNSEEGSEIMKFVGHTGGVNSGIFTQDETKILSASDDGTVRLWNCEEGTEIMKFEGHTDEVNSAIFTQDESKIISASTDILWNCEDGTEYMKFKGGSPGQRGAVCRSWLAGQCRFGAACRYLHSIPVSRSSILAQRESKILTASPCDKAVRLWNSELGIEIMKFEGHTHGVNSAIFTQDESKILTASSDKTVRVWNSWGTLPQWVLQGTEIMKFEGHTDSVISANFSHGFRMYPD